ncbi:MAG: glycerophosphodiester phosphodiesterase family protein [Brumimicrobium sp.]
MLKISIPKDFKILGHKGSGVINENGNLGLQENTWNSIKNAFEKIDGSEIDIQMSEDSTLWVFHDHKIRGCTSDTIHFSKCSDIALKEISKCSYSNELITFESLLKFIKQAAWKDKTLSLDLKVLSNPVMLNIFGTKEGLGRFVAQKLNTLLSEVDVEVLIEVPFIEQYKLFKSHLDYKVFLVNHKPTGDFIKECTTKNVSLSLPIYDLPQKFKPDLENEYQLWTVNDPNQFLQALKYRPNYIQSDNIPLMRFFKQIQNGKELKLDESVPFSVGKGEVAEFYPLLENTIPKTPSLVEFSFLSSNFPEETILVFNVTDSNGESVLWEGIDLSKIKTPYIFIDPEFLKYKKGEAYQMSIWNKSQFKGSLQGEISVFTSGSLH